jgi:hypothetical protein
MERNELMGRRALQVMLIATMVALAAYAMHALPTGRTLKERSRCNRKHRLRRSSLMS